MKLTPESLKLWMSCDFSGLERVDSRTKTKVGWPAAAAAATMNFPMYPVPPIIRILLFPAILKDSPATDSWRRIFV